jgi:hypothetical protein
MTQARTETGLLWRLMIFVLFGISKRVKWRMSLAISNILKYRKKLSLDLTVNLKRFTNVVGYRRK